jgi:TRAP-type C4-dicarboxylate transport system permease small subunit
MGWAERVCELLCEVALVAMVVLVSAEVIARAALGTFLEMADEVGAYLLVAITFLSLSVCVARNAFHYVELIQGRLPPAARAISLVFFDVLALACALVILWQLARLEWISWNSGDVSPTWLMTPLWLPRLSMPIGMLALVITLTKATIVGIRRISMAPDHTPKNG